MGIALSKENDRNDRNKIRRKNTVDKRREGGELFELCGLPWDMGDVTNGRRAGPEQDGNLLFYPLFHTQYKQNRKSEKARLRCQNVPTASGGQFAPRRKGGVGRPSPPFPTGWILYFLSAVLNMKAELFVSFTVRHCALPASGRCVVERRTQTGNGSLPPAA